MQENECTIATEMKWTEITRKIKEHTDKAISKHPKFADSITDTNNIELCREALRKTRFVNDNAKTVVADELLNEEYLEIIEAYLSGNKQQAIEECFDAITVLIRMANFIEREDHA